MDNQSSPSDQASQSTIHEIVEQHLHMLNRLLASEAGYKGLYGGLTKHDIHVRKRLALNQEITDWMSPEELAANIFRASQAEAMLRREQIQDRDSIEQVHFQVGQFVRRTLAEMGSTMPEDLPVPAKSARQVLLKELLWLKQSGEFDSLDTLNNVKIPDPRTARPPEEV